MPSLTIVIGLCGSGKTWLADMILAPVKIDEGFRGKAEKQKAVIAALQRGQDVVIVEAEYCREPARRQEDGAPDGIEALVAGYVPGAVVTWMCVENDLHRANKNCWERTNKGDPQGHVNINKTLSPTYTYPPGAVVLRMWTRTS
jgi:hypothetical protein